MSLAPFPSAPFKLMPTVPTVLLMPVTSIKYSVAELSVTLFIVPPTVELISKSVRSTFFTSLSKVTLKVTVEAPVFVVFGL